MMRPENITPLVQLGLKATSASRAGPLATTSYCHIYLHNPLAAICQLPPPPSW